VILQQVLDHLVGDGLFAQVVEDELHGRVVGKAAILLVEAEEGGMQVDGERGRAAAELAQDVVGRPDEGFGHGLDGRVAARGMRVGARAQPGAQAGSRTAHRMSGLYSRCRRHAECWRCALPLYSKNRWLSRACSVLGRRVRAIEGMRSAPIPGNLLPRPTFPVWAVRVILSHDNPRQGPNKLPSSV
jgi:hypothetical protein